MNKTVTAFYISEDKDKDYENKYHEEHKSRIQWVIKRFNLDKIENKRILDLGCGRGDYFKYLNSNNTFIGIDGADISSKLVPFLSLKLDLNQPFAYILDNEEKFDYVIISETLEHCTQIYGIIEEIKKLLKQDGILLITLPNVGMEHNYLYPALMANPDNWNQFMSQMAFETIDFDIFKDGWPSNCWLYKNKDWNYCRMLFHKNEEKFRGKTPLEQCNI